MQSKVSVMRDPVSDTLNQAIEHEFSEMKRYHLLALRYVTFRPSLSRQMNNLAIECQGRLDRLVDADISHSNAIYCDGFLSLPLMTSVTLKGKHFFVCTEAMAFQLLDEAHFLAHHSLRQYQAWARRICHGETGVLFSDILAQKGAECRVLHIYQTQWPSSPPCLATWPHNCDVRG
ncbi:hypothetical protein DFO67_104337 [Modicisalibacter xianhensis]|uniref:Uncharacterized protein n=2 Tax=Modicisalibacter xianhensis TaxID=442341 RepID=A0A4R8FW26_9GAMM|nr:hypothetical protein DFO67_104337 [Halomonas xianhensis]